MAERGAIGRRLDELPMGVAVSVGVAAGVGAGAGLMVYGGVGALVGFCGAVGAAAGVALSGKPVAEVVSKEEAKPETPPDEEEAKREVPPVAPEHVSTTIKADLIPITEEVRRNARPEHVSTRIEMVRIPGGTFWMGSEYNEPDADNDERPRHEVTLSPFWMARVPVTQKLYREVMGENPGRPVGDDLPVNHVRWHNAIRFCNRLSRMEGLVLAYRELVDEVVWHREADGYRCPTEAEWEYAARGSDGRIYPWGDEPPSNQLCWNGPGNDLGQGNRRGPSPVGSYPSGASPFGLLDMAGNVREWTGDAIGSYDARKQENPHRAPKTYEDRVVRGGFWIDTKASRVRSAVRSSNNAHDRMGYIGFRCARGPVK